MSSSQTEESRATVCITVDFDALSLWMQWGAQGVRALSRGEFGGRVGAPRLLELFDRYEIKTTWFIPGHTADTFPEVTAIVGKRGHEVANHGYVHESFDQHSLDECRGIIRKANASLQRLTDQTPVGFRLPAGDSSGELFSMLVDEGFSYDASLMGEDFQFYWCRAADVIAMDGPNLFGQEVDLVECPASFIMNDFHHFEFNYGTPLLVGHDSPNEVEEGFKGQFDYMYERYSGGVLSVVLHPQCIGQGVRAAMLERFIEYCLARPGTRFARLGDVVGEFRASHDATDKTTPSV